MFQLYAIFVVINGSVHNHINLRSGCTNCSGHVTWNYNRFLLETSNIYHDRYDYSEVHSEMINGVYSRVPIKCNECEHTWESSIDSHINKRCGCPNCANRIPWNFEKFIEVAIRIHGNTFDYSNVKPLKIRNKLSRINITCRSCYRPWLSTIDNHINTRGGCKFCNSSKVQIPLYR